MSISAAQTITAPTSLGIAQTVLNNVHAVGAAWMLSSALYTTYSTTRFLKYVPATKLQQSKKSVLPRATLLTLLRFGGSLALGLLAHPDIRIVKRVKETWNLLPAFSLPALFLFVANYANAISLNRIGISLTYTSKCAIPLITLILTSLLDGVETLPRFPVLLTLVPIAVGIAIASWNHPHFESLGFIAAIVSCMAQSALNLSTKRIMKQMNIAGTVAQRAMVAVGLVLASAVSILQRKSPRSDSKTSNESPPALLSVMACTAYHLEYVLSFTFVKMVAPITYSAADAIRRLSIIVCGHYMFGGPAFTLLNIAGIGMALSGAVAYSILNK